jgi:hypothetical protein
MAVCNRDPLALPEFQLTIIEEKACNQSMPRMIS